MKRNKGFTLIELLVVITIIAVLAAILFPVFLMARAKARQMNCLSNLKQFGTTFNMYIGDWDNKFPYTSFPTGSAQAFGSDVTGMSVNPAASSFFNLFQETWIQKLEPYVKYSLVIGSGAPVGGVPKPGKPQGIMRCKDVDRTWKTTPYLAGNPDAASYGYNFLYLGLPFKSYVDAADADPDAGMKNPYNPVAAGYFLRGAAKLSSIASPAETLLLVENATIWAFPPCKGDAGSTQWIASGNKYIRPRHGNRSDVLYCDGHVTSLETKYLVVRGMPYGNNGNSEKGVATNNAMWDIL